MLYLGVVQTVSYNYSSDLPDSDIGCMTDTMHNIARNYLVYLEQGDTQDGFCFPLPRGTKLFPVSAPSTAILSGMLSLRLRMVSSLSLSVPSSSPSMWMIPGILTLSSHESDISQVIITQGFWFHLKKCKIFNTYKRCI